MEATTTAIQRSASHTEQLRRSISAWERLHAVIVGFALTSAVKIFSDPWPTASGISALLSATRFHLLVAFVATLVPFFHGAQRHLEAVHLSSTSVEKPGLLFFDYIMLFLEGALFALLGMSINNPLHFLHVVLVLIVVDVVWALTTLLSTKKNPALTRWLILDGLSLLFLAILWRGVALEWWSVSLAYGAVIRTAFDYWRNWDFYLDLTPKAGAEGAVA